MTAPMTPVAPSAPATPSSSGPAATTRALMEEVIGGAWKDTLMEQGVAEADLARDDKGRFVPREESDATTDERDTPAGAAAAAPKTAAAAGEAAAGSAAEPALDGETVVLPAADPTQLVTTFILKDAAGELAIPAGLTIAFQANGKMREEPLDRLVKFAEMGVYNHEREQRRQRTEQRAEQAAADAQTVRQALALRDQQLEDLLTDAGFRERAIQEFANQNTPAAREQRLQQQLDVERAERARAEVAPAHQQYLEREIGPSIDMVVKTLPHVTADEVAGMLTAFVQRQQNRGGYVDPSRYPAINDYFLKEIVPYFQQLDDYRAVERGTRSGRQQVEASRAKAQQDTEALTAQQAKTQRVRRQAAQHLTPPMRGAAGTPRAPKPIVTHADAVQSAVETALAETLGRR